MHKAANVTNIILGATFSLISGSFLINVLPRLQQTYTEFQNVPPNFLIPKAISAVILIASLLAIIFGIIGLIKSNNIIKKINIILVIILALVFFVFPILTMTTVAPIYNLAESF